MIFPQLPLWLTSSLLLLKCYLSEIYIEDYLNLCFNIFYLYFYLYLLFENALLFNTHMQICTCMYAYSYICIHTSSSYNVSLSLPQLTSHPLYPPHTHTLTINTAGTEIWCYFVHCRVPSAQRNIRQQSALKKYLLNKQSQFAFPCVEIMFDLPIRL